MACTAECGRVTPSQAHCSTCHQTFGGVSVFDRHRRGGQCIDPSTLGLELKGSVWRSPAPVDGRNWFAGGSVGGTAE